MRLLRRPVRAAGGAVWRRSDDGNVEVLLVHRPRYDDWTLPKGKCERRESDLACALREVEEETGFVCAAGTELPTTTYVDNAGRAKSVRYWAMQVQGGSGELVHEVDETVWLALKQARDRLSYERDRPVIDALEQVVSASL